MRFASNRDIAIGVEDLDKAAEFYEGILGFKPEKTEPKLRIYNTGHFTLYVEKTKNHPPIPSYTVENLHEAKMHLQDNGCNVLAERDRNLYFEDPFGIVWDLVEE